MPGISLSIFASSCHITNVIRVGWKLREIAGIRVRGKKIKLIFHDPRKE